MFSPNVQKDVRQTVAMNQFTSIEDICNELNQEANKQCFLREPVDIDEGKANKFVEAFAYENGMQVRTVQPYAWSFSVDGEKLFDDGVVELHMTNVGKYFVCTKVDMSKITQPQQDKSDTEPSTSENLYAHKAWLNKLNDQVTEWGHDIKDFAEHEKVELGIKLKALESLLKTMKSSSMNVSKDAVIEAERQWNVFHNEISKIKKRMQKSK